jgi:hypothetical protein
MINGASSCFNGRISIPKYYEYKMTLNVYFKVHIYVPELPMRVFLIFPDIHAGPVKIERMSMFHRFQFYSVV